jgi:NAD(P)-dependent dehydrogenase (short-subunit alcohol dehydrogenase family)
MGKLDGKVAVVTGGNSGIGLATARRFAPEGAHVFITGRRKAELDAAVKALGPRITGVQGDVAVLADLDRLYVVVKEPQGRVDVLFANAGGGELVPLGEITEARPPAYGGDCSPNGGIRVLALRGLESVDDHGTHPR